MARLLGVRGASREFTRNLARNLSPGDTHSPGHPQMSSRVEVKPGKGWLVDCL